MGEIDLKIERDKRTAYSKRERKGGRERESKNKQTKLLL